jgi:hypothetical protein
MVRKLHRDSEAVRHGRSLMIWCPIEIIVPRLTDVDALAFAIVQGWIEMSAGTQNVRVTDDGRRSCCGSWPSRANDVAAAPLVR